MIESMHSHLCVIVTCTAIWMWPETGLMCVHNLFLCSLVIAIWQLKFVLEQVGLIAAVTKPGLARLISPPLYL